MCDHMVERTVCLGALFDSAFIAAQNADCWLYGLQARVILSCFGSAMLVCSTALDGF